MELNTLKVPGADAIRVLEEHRSQYTTTGMYPFLIGDAEALERIQESAEFNEQDPAEIIKASLDVDVKDWIERRRQESEEDGISADEMLGNWPGEITEKGSISIHKDILSGKTLKEVFLGFARLESPWHLPAVLQYGAWNDCPDPESHCAFHRHWMKRYDAEITGISGDTIECIVKKPPADREDATILAWEQYWYCADIVEQGCGSVLNLAATILNSRYWFFWWD